MSDSFKATLRVPTAEPYAYLEIQVEDTPEGILEAYTHFTALIKTGPGLATAEWNKCLDKYLRGEGMDVNCHERMNGAQKWLLHEIDKSNTRIQSKEYPRQTKERLT